MKIMFLIPVYNEEKHIGNLLQELNYDKKDIIVVDDGSTDRTAEIVKKKGVVLLKHPNNLGKGYAHRTGFKYAVAQNYDYVITLDGDGQHNPEELLLFIKKINETAEDIIIGTRKFSLKNMPLIRLLTNLTTSFIVSLFSHKRVKDSQSGYRAISKRVLEKVRLTTCNFQTESEMIIKAARLGYHLSSVPISTLYSEEKSKIIPFLDTIRFVKLALKSIWR